MKTLKKLSIAGASLLLPFTTLNAAEKSPVVKNEVVKVLSFCIDENGETKKIDPANIPGVDKIVEQALLEFEANPENDGEGFAENSVLLFSKVEVIDQDGNRLDDADGIDFENLPQIAKIKELLKQAAHEDVNAAMLKAEGDVSKIEKGEIFTFDAIKALLADPNFGEVLELVDGEPDPA